MRNLSLLTKLFIMAFLGLGLALFGCPPDSEGDDDDAAGDDDDAVGDDDDAVGDDDDAVGDDDDATGDCPGCVYTFSITFSTMNENGECLWCWQLADGTYSMGYGSGAVYLEYAGYYGTDWYWWYYGSQAGDTVDFWYDGYYYDYAFAQEGYWNITGGGSDMTGQTSTEETTAGAPNYNIVQSLTGVGI